MQLTEALRSKSIICNIRGTDCNYYYMYAATNRGWRLTLNLH